MKLSNALDNYYYHSGKLSEVVRQLALGGVAVVWLFKFDVGNQPSIPQQLELPLALIVLSLTFDFAHYFFGAAIWGVYHRSLERSGQNEEEEFKAPRWTNWPALFFFWGKALAILGAYMLLLIHLYELVDNA